jgi:Ca2+-binding RTX toxin-like protein
MTGFTGDDTYVVDNVGDVVNENASEGTDEIRTSLATYTIAAMANIENLTGTNAAGHTLTGNGGNNVITGAAGADLIDGGAGNDTMRGGGGNDTYLVDSSSDTIVELASEGTDEVQTGVGLYVLSANVENLTATNNNAHDFRGSNVNNVITTGTANDFIRFQDGGDDTILALAGDDIVYAGGALTGADTVDGGAGARDTLVLQGDYNLTLTGTNAANFEFISTQSGSRTNFGDTADNRYDYNLTTTDAVVVAGQQMVINAQSLLAGEDLTFDGSAETNGRFLIYGGHGTDILTGGSGNDIFFFEGQRWTDGDRVIGNGGLDALVISGVNGVNRIEFEDDSLTSIESISVNNRFATDPTAVPSYELVLANGNVAVGASLTINGSSLAAGKNLSVDGSLIQNGTLNMFGGAGNDVLIGGAKADLIFAAAGADSQTGGGGADVFQFRSVSDSTTGASDRINDFTSGTDKIDLGFIDANAVAAGNQAFTFIGAGAFSNTAGELRAAYDGGSNTWVVQGDVDGDGFADFQLNVTPATPDPLVASDFIL